MATITTIKKDNLKRVYEVMPYLLQDVKPSYKRYREFVFAASKKLFLAKELYPDYYPEEEGGKSEEVDDTIRTLFMFDEGFDDFRALRIEHKLRGITIINLN